MNDLLNLIFGLNPQAGVDEPQSPVGFGSPDAQLNFVHSLPAWVTLIVVLVIVMGVYWSYRAVPGSALARTVLGGARVLTLLILLCVALGPMIEQTSVRTERDWVPVLLDRSGSLSTRDVSHSDPPSSGGLITSGLITRDEQLLKMIEQGSETWDELASSKHVLWMGFDEIARVISENQTPIASEIESPIGKNTDLNAAIRSALKSTRARPISGLIIASDGRASDPIDPELINMLVSAQTPVFAVPLGSSEPVRDIRIAQTAFPTAVFADDLVPIRVQLGGVGIDADELGSSPMALVLTDHVTGEVLDRARISAEHLGLDRSAEANSADPADLNDPADPADPEWITLMHTPDQSGESTFDINIVSDTSNTTESSAGSKIDLNPSNDQASVSLQVVDRPMRVLYIDGYPRWENRYLKNLLLRERSIVSSSILLASSRRYIQEGDELIASIPSTLEQWEPFDVIIIGDVRPELFAQQQLSSMLEHISTRGAGVLWIAGPSATPMGWLDSELSSLLPIQQDAGGSQPTTSIWNSPITMYPSEEASRIGLLGLNDDRTGWLDRLSDPSTGWSKLQWALRVEESSLKPGVGVLASARSADSEEEAPLITTMRHGAGRSILVGTDEIWRWRYGRGEELPERFWLPIIRSLGRGTVDRRVAPASLGFSPKSPSPGHPTQITLRLFEQSRIESVPDEVQIQIESASGSRDTQLMSLRGNGNTRIGTWIPDQPGAYTITLIGLDAELSSIASDVLVLDQSDEQRLLDTDHDVLKRLSTLTGGRVIAPDEFSTIPSALPNRTRTIATPPTQETLWDRPVVLIVLVLLLSVEWIGRKQIRLA